MRKVYVEVKVKLILNMDEGIEVGEVIDDINYEFLSNTEGVDVEDTEILDYNVTDSK